jgi:hypothetical protein
MTADEVDKLEGRDLDRAVKKKLKSMKPYKCKNCGGTQYKAYPHPTWIVTRQCTTCRDQKKYEYQQKEKFRKYRRGWYLGKRYGITMEQYEEMFVAQGGACAICGLEPRQKHRNDTRLCVDHCHETGKVRALLCNSCNIGLSKFKDDSVLLQRAQWYLEEHQ